MALYFARFEHEESIIFSAEAEPDDGDGLAAALAEHGVTVPATEIIVVPPKVFAVAVDDSDPEDWILRPLDGFTEVLNVLHAVEDDVTPAPPELAPR